MSQERLVEELKRSLILSDLGRLEIKRFAPLCELREYESGERIFEQDTLGTELHLLIEGSVEVRVRGSEGGEIRVGTVGKGEVLGEASIFLDQPRTASVVAAQACLLAAVSRDRLFAYCDANPRAGLRIFGFVIFSLLRRLSATNRDLVLEREAVIRPEDLDRLRAFFPKSMEDVLGYET